MASSTEDESPLNENKFPWKGEDEIIDSTEKATDLDGSTKLNLNNGYCHMVGYQCAVMIRKGSEVRKETYDLLRTFQHNSAIPLLNFYINPPSMAGRFVIPRVRCSFEAWVNIKGETSLFDEVGKMTSLFKNMICDMCSVFEKLHSLDMTIKNFNLKNLYIAEEDSPRLLVLLTEVESCTSKLVKGQSWEFVKDVIKWCYEQCGVKSNYLATKYAHFIGSEKFNVMSLENYPDNWNHRTKREYLISVIATNQRTIKNAMIHTDLKWPVIGGKKELPGLLQRIVDHHIGNSRCYRVEVPFHYVMLVRNSYKHFDELPEDVKCKCGDKEGFIKMVEHWTPYFWIHLYHAIGWL